MKISTMKNYKIKERERLGGGGSLVLTVHANGFLWSFTTISMETAKLATSHTHIMQTPQSVQNQRIFESKVPGEISSVLRDRRSSMHTNHTPDDPPPSPPQPPPLPNSRKQQQQELPYKHTPLPASLRKPCPAARLSLTGGDL